MSLDLRAVRRLAALREACLLRRPPQISARRGVEYRLDGHPVVGFCSNDYLGLAAEPAFAKGSAGAGASRLISGDLPEHRAVEALIATTFGSTDAVLFPSGFQLNVGVIPAVVDTNDRVYSDRLNHASIIDGLRLSDPKPSVLPHTAQPPNHSAVAAGVLRWWFTESIFSMDGDRADLRALRSHQEKGGTTYVDEAHACGLFAGGAGLLATTGFQPDILVGTLSKAFGCAGAFVAASRHVCDLIRNRARSFVFSTGVAPLLAAEITNRLQIVAGPRGDARRESLWANARHFEAALLQVDPVLCRPPSPIFPILVGDNDAALTLAAALVKAGVHVQAIRPPTVPAGTARLRVTVTASHTIEQVQGLADTLRRTTRSLSIPINLSPPPTLHANESTRPTDLIR